MDLPEVAVLEDIYVPNLKSDLPHPRVSPSEKQAHVYYLAYGSNMYGISLLLLLITLKMSTERAADFIGRAASTFLKRRGIKPLHSLAVHVPTLELVFDLAALPYFEPRMANVRDISTLSARSTPSFLHQWDDPRGLIGVAYYITVEDLARVYATEGGGSSYDLVDVECWSIPKQGDLDEKPTKVISKVLIVKKKTRIRSVPGQPSLRYLNILRKGARGESTFVSASQHYFSV
jgi:hypothetical protein